MENQLEFENFLANLKDRMLRAGLVVRTTPAQVRNSEFTTVPDHSVGLHVSPVHNDGEAVKNVEVRIVICKTHSDCLENFERTISSVRIPVDATDLVLRNRVNKILEVYDETVQKRTF